MLHLREILLPSDGSTWAEHAFARAVFFAGHHGARLHIVHVSGRGDRPSGTALQSPPPSVSGFRARLHRAAAEAVGLEVVHAEVGARSVEAGILDYATAHDIDLIVMATHGRRGLDHLVLGSVAEAVARQAPCPVLTVRPSQEHSEVEVRHILVPIDFSPHAWLAAAHAKELAALFHAKLCLLHVLEVLPPIGLADLPPKLPSAQEQADARQALLDLSNEAGGPEVPVDAAVVAGHPTLDVIEATREFDIDLLVMATHGRTGLERVLLGSVTERAIQQAPCPVFVVKAFGKQLLHPSERPAAYPQGT